MLGLLVRHPWSLACSVGIASAAATSLANPPQIYPFWPKGEDVVRGGSAAATGYQHNNVLIKENTISEAIYLRRGKALITSGVELEWVNQSPRRPLVGQVTPQVQIQHAQSVGFSASLATSLGLTTSVSASVRSGLVGSVAAEAKIDTQVSSQISAGTTTTASHTFSVEVMIHTYAGPCETTYYSYEYTEYYADAVVEIGDLKRCMRMVPISPHHSGPGGLRGEIVYCFDGIQWGTSGGTGSDLAVRVTGGRTAPTKNCITVPGAQTTP